jgi:glycosyltransferase involved in cell wall biosynthesis
VIDRPQLVIIQNRETQFDAPLFALIHRESLMRLLVIYTEHSAGASSCDQEIGLSPQWDHLASDSYPLRILRRTTAWAMVKLAIQLRRQQPDLVLICGYYPRSHLWLIVILRLLGQRIGLRSDNTLTHTNMKGWSGRVRRLTVGSIQRLFHTWHPVGEQAHAYLRTLSGTERPTHRFAYAVDNEWFAEHASHARQHRSAFLARQGWPDDAYLVLGIMKWTEREDPLTLIAGFRQLLLELPQARLILIGDGPMREQVDAACHALNYAVLRPGYVPYSHLPLWYGRADVFVHPAPDEPWGVSVNEAMSCGVPVLAAAGVGAAVELITSDACGAIFANGDAQSLASLLRGMASQSREARQEAAAAARQSADAWHYKHTIAALRQALRG